MKTLASLFAVLIFAVAAHAQTLRIATYNVNWGNRGGAQLLDAIASADADILCLQETTKQSEAFLRKQLANRYPHFHAVGHLGKYYGERFVFASKHKLENLTFHQPTAGLFGFHTCRFRLGKESVHLINVHLTPFQVEPNGGVLDAMAALSNTEAKHAIEIDKIVGQIDIQHATIIVGDFNSLSTFNAPQRLLTLGFIDSFASIHADADTQPTWRWPTKPVPLALRIDYVFHTPNFRSLKSEIVKRPGSDHYLVVSKLERVGVDNTDSKQ